MNYWIKGLDEYQIKLKIDEIIKKDFNDEVEVEIVDQADDKQSLMTLLDQLTTVSLFSQRKLLIIYNPLFLTSIKSNGESKENKSKKKIEDNKDYQLLNHYYANQDYNFSLVLVLTKKLDERLSDVKAFLKLIQTNSQCYQINDLNDINHKANFIQFYLKQHAIHLDKSCIDALILRLDNDSYSIMNQLNKLIDYPNEINLSIIDLLIQPPLENEVFALSNAINENQLAKAISIFKQLVILNNQPVVLIALLASNYRTLYQVALLKEKGLDDQYIANCLSMNVKRLYFIHKNLRNLTVHQLEEILMIFSSLDQQIKNGEIDPVYGFELALYQCKGVRK